MIDLWQKTPTYDKNRKISNKLLQRSDIIRTIAEPSIFSTHKKNPEVRRWLNHHGNKNKIKTPTFPIKGPSHIHKKISDLLSSTNNKNQSVTPVYALHTFTKGEKIKPHHMTKGSRGVKNGRRYGNWRWKRITIWLLYAGIWDSFCWIKKNGLTRMFCGVSVIFYGREFIVVYFWELLAINLAFSGGFGRGMYSWMNNKWKELGINKFFLAINID